MIALTEEYGAYAQKENDLADAKEKYYKQMEAMQQLEVILRQLMTPEAKSRLTNIKIVNTELYYKVAQMFVQMYESGKLNQRIDDEMLKDFLARIQQKKEMRITRK